MNGQFIKINKFVEWKNDNFVSQLSTKNCKTNRIYSVLMITKTGKGERKFNRM
jgi:hypothetical protein